MQKSTPLNWDDLRFLVALAEQGSLSATARALRVDHTTVGRRVESAERALGVRLFTRSSTGYALTPDGARLLPGLQGLAASVQALRRAAQAGEEAIEGPIRVSAPESFGVSWLAAKLSEFMRAHPRVRVSLDPSGTLVDLARGEAELALRNVRATQQRLVVRRVAELRYGLYASPRYLEQHPMKGLGDLAERRLLGAPLHPPSVESRWLQRLAPGCVPALECELSVALVAAAKAHAGVALLPRYLGDAEPDLVHILAPDAPTETLWLTVHEDARAIPRVRALLDFLKLAFEADAAVFRGR
ncbi:MAG: LysR family transcriptional regulator [Alphaproteobacteria bacterium]|nr:LysR family transcriptional regulator [Alphaproteobacteria bacterium]MCB9792150.1 LysR family transcriptional regulator [Alphaproteobacteria bacterium]